MLLKRNLLKNVTIISCSGSIICILLNYITNISPITGIWFIIYILLVFILSLFGSFKFIQWSLSVNKPIKYDIEGIIKNYPFMSLFSELLPNFEKKIDNEPKEYDTNELSIITTVLEKKLVSSWYVPYISEEIGFPFACKQMLDQMIAKAFQICNKIDNKDVFVDMCAILTSHLKEYKKASKRHETSPGESIEDLFKMTHPISNSKNKNASVEHCTSIVRIVLKELVPWELWDTPYSELLVRIMGKKLDGFIETTIANPVWLNDRLLTLLAKEKESIDTKIQNLEKEVTKEITIEKDKEIVEETKVKPNNDVVKKSTVLQNVGEKKDAKKDVLDVQGTEPVEMKPVLRQRRGRQGRNEVKIYDRIIEGSVKTWETDMDLQCISVGQDLLASLDEMTLSRLWGHEDTEHSPNLRAPSPQPLWFGEEDNMELDLELGKESKKESSPKPAELLRDLQCSVHSAKARIGDLQVPYIDVTRKPYSDEAAGMMEGLLDKGIAGIKKGLRFTGLSDDSQEKQDKSPAHKVVSSEVSPELHRQKPRQEVMEAQEAYISMDEQKEDNGSLSHPFVKQQRIMLQDSMPPGRGRSPTTSSPSPPLSPEPQYEEAADLSASIAKLRSLLQHVPPRAEEVWWEGAEETRGRQARTFSRPPDPAALADEYDMNMERNASPGQTGNNMQRLDKLFTRTVTGVFNSIKTAVGAEGEGAGENSGAPGELRDWTYVCTTTELGVGGVAARLAGSRRALWHVDAALDPLRNLRTKQQPQPVDLEEWLCVCGSRWAAAGSLAGELGLCSSHLAFRLATVLFADVAESMICSWLDECTSWLRKQVFVYFEQMSETSETPAETKLRDFDIEETCRIVGEYMPECVCCVRALASQRRARELAHRCLDALAARYHAAAMQH